MLMRIAHVIFTYRRRLSFTLRYMVKYFEGAVFSSLDASILMNAACHNVISHLLA